MAFFATLFSFESAKISGDFSETLKDFSVRYFFRGSCEKIHEKRKGVI
jgi:hypothetical protein